MNVQYARPHPHSPLAPVVVRLDCKPDGSSVLTTKIAFGEAGFGTGTLVQDRSQQLTRASTQIFLQRLQTLAFWTLPNPVHDQAGTDGSQWIIEGVKAGRYHIVDRWTPRSGPVREIGSMLAFDLAGITLPKSEVY